MSRYRPIADITGRDGLRQSVFAVAIGVKADAARCGPNVCFDPKRTRVDPDGIGWRANE